MRVGQDASDVLEYAHVLPPLAGLKGGGESAKRENQSQGKAEGAKHYSVFSDDYFNFF